MLSLRRITSVAILIAASLAGAQQLKVEQYRLGNGMNVILHEDHSLPMATVNIWYRVGSKDEPDHRSGFAHLFEHLMFMGTKRVPTGHFDQIMERVGGNNNASTTEDRTNFYSVGPSNILPMLLWLDAERLESLAASMTKAKLDLQRDVVRNERRENTENTPYGKAYEAINSLVFPKDHPYSWSVIGSHEDLQRATVQNVKDFFNTFYVPNNASLVVAGDFRPAEVKPLIAKWFGTLPRRAEAPRRVSPPLNLNKVKRVTMKDQVQFPKTIMAWHSPRAYTSGDIAMQFASNVLSNGLDSRLYDRLVVRDKLASEVSTFQEPRKLGSLFYVDATASQGVSLDKLEAAIDDEMAKFRAEGPKPEELDRVKAQIEFGYLNGLQSLQDKADKLNEYYFYFGNANSFKKVLDMYRAVTPAQVKATSADVLDPNKRLILRVIPEQGRPMRMASVAPVLSVGAPHVQVVKHVSNPRNQRPAISPERPFTPPLPTEFTVGATKVFYWHRPELPLMSMTTVFPIGAMIDPAEKAGRSAMMAEMLDEGAGSRNAKEFENALDQIGASFGAGASLQAVTASMSVTAANFSQGLSLYADALLRPRFEAAEWERVKRTTVAALEQQVDDPATVARQVALREYFGWNHPFGRPVTGTAATVENLSLEDIKADYSQVVRPGTMFIAGSLPLGVVEGLLRRQFGSWPSQVTIAGPNPLVTDPGAGPLRLFVVDKPGAVQTVIRFLLPGANYQDPRRIRMEALGTILGGSFTSRLNQNLREAKGYTYGAGSGYVFEESLGYFVASASVRADVTGASIKEFLKELRGLRSGNVTANETEKARSIQRASAVEAMGSLQSMIGTAVALYLHGRPFADIGKQLTAISQLTPKDLNAVAKEAVDLDRGVLVLVGDKGTILKQLEGLGLPKAEVVEPVK
jgi:predicted Zn-dependent peptidase